VVKATGALILGPIYIQQIYYGSHRSLQIVLMEEWVIQRLREKDWCLVMETHAWKEVSTSEVSASVWTPLVSIKECTSKGNFMIKNLHYPDVMGAQCSKKVLSCRRALNRSRSPAISRELATLFSVQTLLFLLQNAGNAFKEAQIWTEFFQKHAPSVFASRAFAARFFPLHLLQGRVVRSWVKITQG